MAKSKKSGTKMQLLSPENYIRQRARSLPVAECWVNSAWVDVGMANVSVARQHSNGNYTVGHYLVDLNCLGVKDCIAYFNLTPTEYKDLMADLFESVEFEQVPYALVHNIVYAGVAFAEDFGFQPFADFTSVAQYILKEDTDDVQLIDIECGSNGQPLYVKDPDDSEAQVRKVIATLERTAGVGNFMVVDLDEPLHGDDDEEDDDWEDDFGCMEDEEPLDLSFTETELQQSNTLQLKIVLEGVEEPPVWRQVAVPSYYTFEHLHHVIQAVFGWANSHLFQFSDKGFDSPIFITHVYEYVEVDGTPIDASNLRISDVFKRKGKRQIYIYDFGDMWTHTVTLEQTIKQPSRIPMILDGGGACPPDDCGGYRGYEEMREALMDVNNPEHDSYRDWLGLDEGEVWDPETFDKEEIQQRLSVRFMW